ncbi:MAG: hypothetical protein NXI13_09065 [Proteobacteria bacterium]|nr:hypothetical protein [Pseudomonadota bacterium]
MDNDTPEVLDLEALVDDRLSGRSGFANTKKLRKLGLSEYKTWLQGRLAEKMVRLNDPRKRKRAERKAEKSTD